MASIIIHQEFEIDVFNKTVIEFGSGVGLSSIDCAVSDPKSVVATDYPDLTLIDNLRHNCAKYENITVIEHQ
jgi:predicted nicotinamide N-methyase